MSPANRGFVFAMLDDAFRNLSGYDGELELFPIEVDRRKALALCLSEHLCPIERVDRSNDALGNISLT